MFRNKRRLTVLLLAVILLLSGCTQLDALLGKQDPEVPPQPVTYTHAGASITLIDTFIQREYISYTMCFESEDIAVMALKEEFTLFANTDYSAESTLADYATLVWNANSMAGVPELITDGDMTYFDYARSANGNDYTVRTYVFKTNDAFWMFQFTALTENFAAVEAQIDSYAATIVFA